MSNLHLTTYSNTKGYTGGQTKPNQSVTPTTTVVADIIHYENSTNPEARMAELILRAESDPNLSLVVAMANRLFQTMVAHQFDAHLGDAGGSRGRDGGDDDDGGGDGDTGGVGGDAGDGADFSPLIEAECAFVTGAGGDFITAERIRLPVLDEFCKRGASVRQDLLPLVDTVMSGVTKSPEEIRRAFEAWFPQGLGEELVTLTDGQGAYFLPVPAALPGYMRCTPKDRRHLVVGTYIPARMAGTDLMGQDVNPATTIFSTLIASKRQGDLTAAKQIFLEDIQGLKVLLSGPNLPEEGPLDGITLGQPPANNEMGMVAFSATALFNTFLKGDQDVDFPAAIEDLAENLTLRPAFLEAQGVPAAQAQESATLVNTAIGNAAGQLGTTIASAFSTVRITVTVVDAADGSFIPGAVVNMDIEGNQTCVGCGATTDSDGRLTLTLGGIPEEGAEIGMTVSAQPDYGQVRTAIQVLTFDIVEVTVGLSTATQESGTISGAVLDALTETPLAGVRVTVFTDGRQVATSTTGGEGHFTVQCALGHIYSLAFEIDGYLPTRYDGVTVSADDTTFLETTLQVSEDYAGTGGISGTIRSALNNAGIAGVSLELREGINNLSGSISASTTTGFGGGYEFSDIPAGVYTLSASHGGYLDANFTVISVGGETRAGQDGSMSPVLEAGEIRIVLTWGESPEDLDSHTRGPSSSGDSFHCYWGDQNPDPGYVNLDLDDTTSFGPETTTIEQRLPGTYQFQVYDYSNLDSTTSDALSNSNAQVRVYGDAGELATFNIPTGQPGTVWTVFELNGVSGQITPQNTLSFLVTPGTARQLRGEHDMPPKEEEP
jgi:5-hydroxyisourate hydrolase-like protein (transthyretin family)